MADVTIESNAETDTWEVAVRAGPFWTSSTVGYIVYSNSAQDLTYRKTNDGGDTWNSAINIKTGDMAVFDCWADWQTEGDAGTKIHIAYIDIGTDDVRYIYLDTDGDSVGGDNQIEACQGSGVIYSGTNRNYYLISITKTRGGNLAVALRYRDSVGGLFYEFYTSPDTTTWTNEATSWEVSSYRDQILLFPANLADNQDLWCIYWDGSANDISLKTYDDSDNSWSGQLIDGSAAYSPIYLQFDGAVRFSDGHLILAYWTQYHYNLADVRVWDITDAGTIVEKTNALTDKDDSFLVSVFIDQSTNDIYVTYQSGAAPASLTQTFYQKSVNGGGSWGGEQAMQADVEDDIRWISAGAVKEEWGGKFQPVWFNDDFNDIFCNTDNGITIDVEAPPVGQPYISRVQGVQGMRSYGGF